ncbi:hypothetical protein GGR54DRAFT_636441 [Hypoxylon sp. NC1633]|nr:hypothetical protein GGR54DRAFT_636441 [Hypoxylon sp. NC1633]
MSDIQYELDNAFDDNFCARALEVFQENNAAQASLEVFRKNNAAQVEACRSRTSTLIAEILQALEKGKEKEAFYLEWLESKVGPGPVQTTAMEEAAQQFSSLCKPRNFRSKKFNIEVTLTFRQGPSSSSSANPSGKDKRPLESVDGPEPARKLACTETNQEQRNGAAEVVRPAQSVPERGVPSSSASLPVSGKQPFKSGNNQNQHRFQRRKCNGVMLPGPFVLSNECLFEVDGANKTWAEADNRICWAFYEDKNSVRSDFVPESRRLMENGDS